MLSDQYSSMTTPSVTAVPFTSIIQNSASRPGWARTSHVSRTFLSPKYAAAVRQRTIGPSVTVHTCGPPYRPHLIRIRHCVVSVRPSVHDRTKLRSKSHRLFATGMWQSFRHISSLHADASLAKMLTLPTICLSTGLLHAFFLLKIRNAIVEFQCSVDITSDTNIWWCIFEFKCQGHWKLKCKKKNYFCA